MNDKSARLMKPDFSEIIKMIFGMKEINKKIELLNKSGYEVNSFLDIVKNDNKTNTIVYTSKEFQPLVETFSDKYAFVGSSVSKVIYEREEKNRKQIYISLGTVNNKNNNFYKNCIEAFKNLDVDVIMSVGSKTNIKSLGEIPSNFRIENSVEQVKVLQNTDVFITHCGMNSVNESLYYEVPMGLFPQHSEQRMVANRVQELGAGVILKKNTSKSIKELTFKIMKDENYRKNAEKISVSFKDSGVSRRAAHKIIEVIEN